ncbi:hypothetical protein R75461_07623 [Paraburkholderia nemoris]|uniref:hypothetical protein n=1 Tax=Paraburkholderia nemoris TaxID=2793076 RepID=UPI00190A3CE1|nr:MULTISPECIES: hypothetical protein [Paraburkholderia]MBK3786427.1 hypothetical protein [Paraburkholderia aspalathi]CAE6854190.1 hypothetical protein R75461_07623 [Paraburkholderia nemoris]
MFEEVMERFEKQAPISVMARLTLEHAIAPEWVNEVFAASRQRQYPGCQAGNPEYAVH